MIESYMKFARNLSNDFNFIFAKELFSSFVLKSFEGYLIVSLGGDEIKSALTQESLLHYFVKHMVHIFKQKMLGFTFIFTRLFS